ncbi:MAG: HEAT repeat domain-containing protein, partial [Promethearchaeota archaeon]
LWEKMAHNQRADLVPKRKPTQGIFNSKKELISDLIYKIKFLKIKMLMFIEDYLKHGTSKEIMKIDEIFKFLTTFFSSELDEDFKILTLLIIGKIKKRSAVDFLKTASLDDKLLYFALISLMDNNKKEFSELVLTNLNSNKMRRKIMSSLFVPYILPEYNMRLIETLKKLLENKQSLALRQALWIIRKRKIYELLPQIINFIFDNDERVQREAYKTLMELKPKSYDLLKKRVNYYNMKNKEIIIKLIKDLRPH